MFSVGKSLILHSQFPKNFFRKGWSSQSRDPPKTKMLDLRNFHDLLFDIILWLYVLHIVMFYHRKPSYYLQVCFFLNKINIFIHSFQKRACTNSPAPSYYNLRKLINTNAWAEDSNLVLFILLPNYTAGNYSTFIFYS